jgi:hypothetical protein
MKRPAALIALVALAGCGGAQPAAKPSPEAQVLAALGRYDDAKRQQDPQQFCDALSADYRHGIESFAHMHCTLVVPSWIAYIPEAMRMMGTRVASVRVQGNTATVTVRAEPSGAKGPDVVLVRDFGKGWKVQNPPRWPGSPYYQGCLRDYQNYIAAQTGWWRTISHATIDEFTRRLCTRAERLPARTRETLQRTAREVWWEMCVAGRLHRRLGVTGFKAPSAPDTLQGEV